MNDLWLIVLAGCLLLLVLWISWRHQLFHMAAGWLNPLVVSLDDMDPQDWRIVLETEVVQ